ncbi:MAG TPA: hypothetical protein VIX82_18730 [Solirubrobacteraceae bacterium]
MHALQRIHAALDAGGLIVDTQPVSAHPAVEASGRPLGALDMREWMGTVEAVDALTAQTIDDGLYSMGVERLFTVVDTWDSGRECVETVGGWQGTRISHALAERIAEASPPLTVHQEVRLQLLRARGTRLCPTDAPFRSIHLITSMFSVARAGFEPARDGL